MSANLHFLLASLCIASLNQIGEFSFQQERLNQQISSQDKLQQLELKIIALLEKQQHQITSLITQFLSGNILLDACKQQSLELITQINEQMLLIIKQTQTTSLLQHEAPQSIIRLIQANLNWNLNNISGLLAELFNSYLKPYLNQAELAQNSCTRPIHLTEQELWLQQLNYSVYQQPQKCFSANNATVATMIKAIIGKI